MDPAQLQPGHRLDRYELLCPLAYGGMASVWLARFGGRKGFERLVVVKMILPQYAQDPRFQEMFLDEARIASRIEHQNVARILDVGEHFGEQEENTFIVMEWVDGDSLSKVVRAAEQKKQQIPAGISLRICADAAAGLHAAHVLEERDGTLLGVVHRDVSPQNILISNAGTTVLIDFGVAKARDRVSQETSAGQLKGKIRYMAPEQALGRNIDHRADVWALGAILYELFAGVPPYDGPNEVATLHKLTSGARPAPLPAHLPAPVRAVIHRALSYEVEERYATAMELNLALESCLLEIGEPTTTSVVAHYTAQLLSDRKAARKRAVDTALAAAYARDAERAATSQSFAGMAVPQSALSSTPGVRSLLQAPPTGHPFERELGSSPSQGPMGTMGFTEAPSAASSATLGSAAMEYPPREPAMDDLARRRRFVAAAVLGVSVAAGVIGAVLIISTAILKSSAKDATGTATANGATQTTAPPEATDPPSLGEGAAAAATAGASVTAAAEPTAATPTAWLDARVGAAPPPAATPSPAPAPAPIPAAATTTTTTGGSFTGAATHRPAPPPAAAPRPKPPPAAPLAAPTGKPDRGF